MRRLVTIKRGRGCNWDYVLCRSADSQILYVKSDKRKAQLAMC